MLPCDDLHASAKATRDIEGSGIESSSATANQSHPERLYCGVDIVKRIANNLRPPLWTFEGSPEEIVRIIYEEPPTNSYFVSDCGRIAFHIGQTVQPERELLY